MKSKVLNSAFGAMFAVGGLVAGLTDRVDAADPSLNAHSFKFQAIEGGEHPLSQYAGKTLLIVNTASFCGFTPQYEGLQALWEEYGDLGLVVLGVPSNDFGQQEPGTADEIVEFCQGAYGVTFPLTMKEVVKGENAHPFYHWAKSVLGSRKAPRWNFHKYLVGPDGRLIDGFGPSVRPESQKMRDAITQSLAGT